MEKKIYYCDYCGKRLTPSKIPKIVKTAWSIEGDGCNDCYKSFKKWVKSRKLSNNAPYTK